MVRKHCPFQQVLLVGLVYFQCAQIVLQKAGSFRCKTSNYSSWNKHHDVDVEQFQLQSAHIRRVSVHRASRKLQNIDYEKLALPPVSPPDKQVSAIFSALHLKREFDTSRLLIYSNKVHQYVIPYASQPG